jgi:hypothetical protein
MTTKHKFAVEFNTAAMLRDGNVSNVLKFAALDSFMDVEQITLHSVYADAYMHDNGVTSGYTISNYGWQGVE